MLILVRLAAELTVKSRHVRTRFQNRLVSNMSSALKDAGVKFHIRNEWGRLFVDADSTLALPVLARVAGVSSLSPVDKTCPPNLEAIIETGVQLYSAGLEGKSYAVRAHRAADLGFRSVDVEHMLGAALKPFSAGVNLKHPDVLIQVDIREDTAYFFSRSIAGSGGLPLGTGGKALVLISGGFDSAVAAWLVMKRGIEVDFLFCNLAGEAYERSVLGVVHFLIRMWGAGTQPKIHVVDFTQVTREIRESVTNRYAQVILKRDFYRIAEGIAQQTGCEAIVTGEALAQVSSQTLTNLTVIERAVVISVLRPLIGFDKNEIIAVANKLGTYVLCAPIQEYCSITPKNPATRARLHDILEEEVKLPTHHLQKPMDSLRTRLVLELMEKDMAMPAVFTEEVEDNDVFVDIRPADQFAMWHMPNAVRVDLDHLGEASRSWDKNLRYVVYCSLGMQSTVAAERLRTAGFKAFSFRGGARRLKDWPDRQKG